MRQQLRRDGVCHEMSGTHERGFTLIELIAVVTIIAIIGSFIAMSFRQPTIKVRMLKVKNDLGRIVDAAEVVYLSLGVFPESLEGIRGARDAQGQKIIGLKIEDDPWGNPYRYELGDDGPIASCLGRDGVEGGEGEDADLFVTVE